VKADWSFDFAVMSEITIARGCDQAHTLHVKLFFSFLP
jgi:hypothetical protein